MTGTRLLFDPLLPWPWFMVLAAFTVGLLAWGLWLRARGLTLRALFLGGLLLVLAGPELYRERARILPDRVLLVVDESFSQRLDGRPQQTERALAELRQRLDELTGLEVEVLRVPGDPREGTRLFGPLRRRLAAGDPGRLAAVVLVSDGQVHDVPATFRGWPEEVPLHLMLTGRRDERDRALVVEAAPTYAVVGEEQTLVLRVVDEPVRGAARARLRLSLDGRPVFDRPVPVGQPVRVPFVLESGGRVTLEATVEPLAGELTARNNRVTLTVHGIRDRLRVLLVSGLPHQGLRVWRNLLKADPNVDLVHFTILRPPEKMDGTPIRELALIAFPTTELFEDKLEEFDLVIFDRYMRRGLLPLIYLDNIARYVEQGGALLEAAGPEFATPLSLHRTPLARVLPARPTGDVLEVAFRPRVTAVGRRHPVTRGLAPEEGEPRWGRWLRLVDSETTRGRVVMTGAGGRPLLVLAQMGEGRVAQLLSDQAWLWARGFDGGGPQARLLRRLIHWLMKEPELQEEQLIARSRGDRIEIERRSLAPDPVTLRITTPSGRQLERRLEPDRDGIARLTIAAEEEGLYRIEDGEHTAYAAPRPIARRELERVRATESRLQPLVVATGGGIFRLEDGLPRPRRVAEGRPAVGRGWFGLRERQQRLVLGSERLPLLPPWLVLALLAGAAVLAWWREGHRSG